MNKFEANFYKYVELLSAILLCFMVVTVFTNIFCRYFLNISIASTEEMSRFAFIWISFIGSALCLKSNEHLSIDIITNLLPKRLKSLVYLFDQLIVLVIAVVFTIGGIVLTMSDMGTRSAATNIRFGYIDMIVPLVSVLMVIIQLQKIYAFILKRNKISINANAEREA